MTRRLHRTAALAAGTLAITMTLAACGSDSTGSSDSTEGVEQAKAEVAKYTKATEFEIEALSSTPPAGQVVAQVNCTLPTCSPGALEAPIEALDWELDLFEYDLAKGPQDLVRAFDQALDSEPDYITVTMVFPEEIVSEQLERAEANGIPVINVGGSELSGAAALLQGPRVFEEAGAIAANVALADAGKAVNAVMPVDPAIPLHVNIAEGVKNELEEVSPDSKAELLELSLAQPAATNVSGIVNYLKANPDTQYIVFGGTSLYAGLNQALQGAGLADTVKLVLTFPFPSDIQAIEDGEFIAAVAGEAIHQWRQADVMARLSVGEELAEKEPLNSFRIITQDSVTPESIDPPDYVNVYTTAWGV